MGIAKSQWLEVEELGWDAPEKFVCPECVEDDFLREVIRLAATEPACDYCGRTCEADLAAPVEAIMPHIVGALRHGFAEPGDAGVPYETAEGGYLVPATDTEDALLSLPLECHDELFRDVVAAIVNDSWVEAANGHWASVQDSQVLEYAWARFSDHVKHRQRYFFLGATEEEGQDVAPSRLMPLLGRIVTDLSLVARITEGAELFRVRSRMPTDSWPLDAGNLGAPPTERATAGRMNPAGISYLYLALERETAIAEIVRGPPCELAVGRFRAARGLRLLNLVDLPEIPSMFDSGRIRERELLIFLGNFVASIAKPVEKDLFDHVEYVPSQVVCEYFATAFESGNPFDGLLYPSAIRSGGRNLVLFPRESDGRSVFPQVVFTTGELMAAPNWTSVVDVLGV